MRYKNLFFDFNYINVLGESFKISKNSKIISDVQGYAADYAKSVLAEAAKGERNVEIFLRSATPCEIIERIDGYKSCPEAYVIEITESEVKLFSESKRGLIYAVSTLKQLIQSDAVAPLILFDCPDKPVRGYRVFTPGRDSIAEFKKMIDMLVYYKYNSVMIEVGGAMEYERHPLINEKWVEFCGEVHKSPDESARIQHRTHPEWKKNSIHADNGDGGFISKSQMRELVNYCREREISVIPEIPTLSHSDYILRAYPELNERKADTYPDTYCPSNPKTYEVVFDIIDEILEVFSPEYVNIGHDECYTLGICERCRGKSPVDLYSDDIIKLSEYLKERGVKTFMWGEKLYNIHLVDRNGNKWSTGGAGNEKEPTLYPCKHKIPTDVLQLHWFWLRSTYEEDKEIYDLGFRSVYGNFLAPELDDYRHRSALSAGAFVSNWGSLKEEYMQRNGQNFYLISGAYIFWCEDYDTPMKDFVYEITKKELYKRHLDSLGEDIIEIVHTTEHKRPYAAFYDGNYIVEENDTLGAYKLSYEDGKVFRLPVRYGYNILSEDERGRGFKSTEAIPDAPIEVIGAAIPTELDGKIYYKTAYENPHPGGRIRKIEFSPENGAKIRIKKIDVGKNPRNLSEMP